MISFTITYTGLNAFNLTFTILSPPMQTLP